MPNATAPVRFAAGAAAVLTAHQAAVWALHRAGATPWPAYSLAPTWPLGVPQVASAAFWGGAWWAALSPAVERAGGAAAYWRRAAVLGAVPPTAVGALLAAAGRAFPRGDASLAVLLAAGLGVNALWGIAAAALVRLSLPRPPGRLPGTAARTAGRWRA
ncbi:hypothetical protein tb265_20850 [Gemmatimonadetes bacterium T265]|nr:hypothetical protein tb265_20850 [Gemmatimonadetes bacterium T265]